MVRRNVPLRALDVNKPEPGAKGNYRQLVAIKEGVTTEKARDIVKALKDSKIKVQAAIQSDHVRVSGKKKDDLQAAIRLLKGQDFGIDLQYANFRE